MQAELELIPKILDVKPEVAKKIVFNENGSARVYCEGPGKGLLIQAERTEASTGVITGKIRDLTFGICVCNNQGNCTIGNRDNGDCDKLNDKNESKEINKRTVYFNIEFKNDGSNIGEIYDLLNKYDIDYSRDKSLIMDNNMEILGYADPSIIIELTEMIKKITIEEGTTVTTNTQSEGDSIHISTKINRNS